MSLEDKLTVEDGARLYLDYLRENEEDSVSLTRFYTNFDTEKCQITNDKEGRNLKRHYGRFMWQRKNKKVPKNISFEDWVKEQIPEELRQELDELAEKHLKEYTLEEGTKFYLEHLKENKSNSMRFTEFHIRFNPKTGEVMSKGDKKGPLGVHYRRFIFLRRKGKLPKDMKFIQWVKPQLPEELRQELDELAEEYSLRPYSLEEAAEFYIEHVKEHKENSKTLLAFCTVFDPKTKKFRHYSKPGKLSTLYGTFSTHKRKGIHPEDLSFEDYVKQNISPKLRGELETLLEKYSPTNVIDDAIEQGAILYIAHLQKNKEKSIQITKFFREFDIEKQELLPDRKQGQLGRYYSKFLYLIRHGKFSKEMEFIDWVKQKIPPELRQKLEELTEKYIPEGYSLEQGVELYVQHLKENKEESISLHGFIRRYDTEKQRILSYKGHGQLKHFISGFSASRLKGRIPKNLSFDDWVKERISEELRQELEELTEKYLKEYSLDQGAELYIKHLKENKEKSRSISVFYQRFNPLSQKVFSQPKTCQLNRHYAKFRKCLKKGEIPEDTTFLDWVLDNISPELRKELKPLTSQYFPEEYSLDQGAEFYVQHLKENKGKSLPITSFYVRFDPESKKILGSKAGVGLLNRHYSRFLARKKRKEFNESTFEDYVKSKVSPELRQELEGLIEEYLPEGYTLEQGVEFYIQHLEQFKDKSASLRGFFTRFDPETGRLKPKRQESVGGLHRHTAKYSYEKNQGRLPPRTSFADYLISQLPEEKKQRAEYYLKGQYLNDLVDGAVLKHAALKGI